MIRPMRFACPVLVIALLAGAAQAQDYDAQIKAAADDLAPPQRKSASMHRGRPHVAGQVTLTEPIVDNGRTIDRVDIMQEWDCKTGRYRILRKTFRTSDGEYVHSDPRDTGWIATPDGAPGSETRKRVCPKTADPATAPAARPSGPQVITMPRN
jgi:hypothetical protein